MSRLKLLVFLFVWTLTVATAAVGFNYLTDTIDYQQEQLAAAQLQIAKNRASITISTEYEATLQALIGKLQEYNRVDQYTPEQITDLTRVVLEQVAIHRDDGLTPSRVLAVIEQESGFDSAAISRYRAYGIMQVRRIAGQQIVERMGYTWSPDLLLDPVLNVRVGVDYLMFLHRALVSEGLEETDDFKLSYIAYNNGPTAMLAWLAGNGQVNESYAEEVRNKALQYAVNGLD